MDITVNGAKTYAYTGGRPFDATKPTVVFIHGVLNDHSAWILQSRYLAHHGFNVLPSTCPATAAARAKPPKRWNRRPISSPPCWTPRACSAPPWWATAGARLSRWKLLRACKTA